MKQHVLQKTKEQLIQDALNNAMDYAGYRNLVSKLVAERKSTGPIQNKELSDYTQLNDQRMKRLDKTIKINAASELIIKEFNRKTIWLVLTESWCGDAAQTLPIMNKIVGLNSHISLQLVLRDENPALMEQFLTNGAMSIPKLIAIDAISGTIVGEWGPRPSLATKMVEDQKNKFGQLSPGFRQELQVWYNKDKGQNTVNDLLSLLFLE